jgi:hypothetical protein
MVIESPTLRMLFKLYKTWKPRQEKAITILMLFLGCICSNYHVSKLMFISSIDVRQTDFGNPKMRYCRILWIDSFSSGDFLNAIHKLNSSNQLLQ